MAAVWVTSPALGLKLRCLSGYNVAGEVLERFERDTGLCDFYVVCNGRVVGGDEPLQNGSIYHLEPRLRGGKGGFGSMLRALGAQIEKTTNREACRDLSGRRLRDVNHEKEMADWLKKQAEREAEKEQRRLERLQKKLAEPKHHFTDSKYTQQCHELSERLEDSVIKGLQASSSSAVRPEATKRPSEERDGPESKRSKGSFTWSGLDLDSDEDSDTDQSTGSEEAEPMSREAESEDSGQSSSSPAPSEGQSTGARPSPGPSSRPDPECRPEGEPQTTPESTPESSCGAERDPESSCGAERDPESSCGAERDPESSCGAERDPESKPESSCGAERDPESTPESSCGAERDPESKPESSCGAERDPESSCGAERDPESSCGAERDPESSCGAQRDPESSCGAERDPESKPESSCGAERDPESRPQGESSPDEVQTKPESSSRPDQDESQEQRPLDLDSVSRVEDLEALGLNALKEELMRRGLKCGGTLSERAARLFSVRGKREGDIDRALIAKNTKKKHK